METRAQMHLIYIVCLLLTDADRKKNKNKNNNLIASWLIQLWSEKQAVMYLGVHMPRPETKKIFTSLDNK